MSELPGNEMRLKALAETPPSLYDTFVRILDRIVNYNGDIQATACKALHWIALQDYDLPVNSLRVAISVDDEYKLRTFTEQYYRQGQDTTDISWSHPTKL